MIGLLWWFKTGKSGKLSVGWKIGSKLKDDSIISIFNPNPTWYSKNTKKKIRSRSNTLKLDLISTTHKHTIQSNDANPITLKIDLENVITKMDVFWMTVETINQIHDDESHHLAQLFCNLCFNYELFLVFFVRIIYNLCTCYLRNTNINLHPKLTSVSFLTTWKHKTTHNFRPPTALIHLISLRCVRVR